MSNDPANSCALYITVHSHSSTNRKPALSARFQFEDHIRCVAARQCLQRNKENLRLAKMTRVAKLLHLPIPDPTADSLHPLPSSDQPDIGSFVALSPLQQLSSPLADLTRSGLHQALQNLPLPEGPTAQGIEMAQIQSTTLEASMTKMTEIHIHTCSEHTQLPQSNTSGQLQASPDTATTGISQVEERGSSGHCTPQLMSSYTTT